MAPAHALLAVGLLAVATAAPTKTATAQLTPDGSNLRGAISNVTNFHALHGGVIPCMCDLGTSLWTAPKRTVPECIFLDLGAADGNTFRDFLDGRYGIVANCPSGGKYEATLVEANPRFNNALQQEMTKHPGAVHSKFATAAYMCEATTTFYLDTKSVKENYWGSSMSANHVDTKRSGHVQVTVPTVNILKMLHETTIPGDYVILKMDIEGAEWDVLPCLANSPVASLIDRLLVEVHPIQWGNAGTTQLQFDTALKQLRAKGVDIPSDYHSQTL